MIYNTQDYTSQFLKNYHLINFRKMKPLPIYIYFSVTLNLQVLDRLMIAEKTGSNYVPRKCLVVP